MDRRSSQVKDDRGFTLIELMIVLVIIALVAATAAPIYQTALQRARNLALAADLVDLHGALVRYHADYGKFPGDAGADRFDTRTLEPLVSRSYLRNGKLIDKLFDKRIVLYVAPDWKGRDSDFLILARPQDDPSVWVYVMQYELPGAFSYDGVYVWEDGQLVRWDGKL